MKRRASNADRVSEARGEQGFWPSYADMMSSFALILFFLMLLSYIQNLITGKDLKNTQEVLAATKLLVSQTEDELADITALLGDARLTLDRQQEEIAGYALAIEEQTETIAAQEKLISDQSIYLSAANEEILEMRAQMQTIAVLRLSILERIKDSISGVMGGADRVRIGENGNIILNDSVFFDVGSSAIKPGSEGVLNEMIRVFEEFLSDPENVKYVDSIVISGHTDSTGTEESNRILSTDRANSVLNYLLGGQNGKLMSYTSYFCASGYGETRPVATNDTAEGRSMNRRIEISIILKDDTILDIVDSYLAIEPPAGEGEKPGEEASNANN